MVVRVGLFHYSHGNFFSNTVYRCYHQPTVDPEQSYDFLLPARFISSNIGSSMSAPYPI